MFIGFPIPSVYQTIMTYEERLNMENTVDRSKSWNNMIYKIFSEKEISELTDEEFARLYDKIERPLHYSLPWVSEFYKNYFTGRNMDAFDWDKTELAIFRRKLAADFYLFGNCDQYARIFSMCHTLGIKNIFDIGCGLNLQAFLMVYSPDMHYTGIDDIFCQHLEFGWPVDGDFNKVAFSPDPAYLNELFKDFVGSDRIQFVKDTYPCKLEIPENNIAIALGSISAAVKYRPEIVQTLAQDFERVMIDMPDKKLNVNGHSAKEVIYEDIDVWKDVTEEYVERMKEAMPEFTFYGFGGHIYHLFGTRISSDKERLESKFTFVNGRFMTGLFDMEWYREMDK